jgi:hypothetical protein
MVPNKSQFEVNLVTTLLHDVCKSHAAVFNATSLKRTTKVVHSRFESEGISFLTKTLPALAKALDRALAGEQPLNCSELGFKPLSELSNLPLFMGEFFQLVLHSDGTALPGPCVISIGILRQILYLFYKYELKNSSSDEQKVLDQFLQTERDLVDVDKVLIYHQKLLHIDGVRLYGPMKDSILLGDPANPSLGYFKPGEDTLGLYNLLFSRRSIHIVRRARIALRKALAGIDLSDITPAHGPGVVSTKETPWGKYVWTNVSSRITALYPYDAFFCASLGAVCDSYPTFEKVGESEPPAQVILVPKDSRGPRLISCEPVDKQWIQQGIRSVLYRHVKASPLVGTQVLFTDQTPNQRAALSGSIDGKHSTLDLQEASDRVSLELVRLLFPEELLPYLECCRSEETVMPNGERVSLRKFAPMGSALCFPIMALSIWALLYATAHDQDTKDRILVYGDDVIVPTAFAADAITVLELFGLKVNRNKSCTKGFFRESCGVDAYKGINITPVKIKTVWTSHPSPESFMSWVAYANYFYKRNCFGVYELIVAQLTGLYWPIANKTDHPRSLVKLEEAAVQSRPVPYRWNRRLQRREFKTLEYTARKVIRVLPGWNMLLRFVIETADRPAMNATGYDGGSYSPHSVSQYTIRNAGKLAARWR